jgi:hypothetical protein
VPVKYLRPERSELRGVWEAAPLGKSYEGRYGAVPTTARRAKRENGGLGEDPPGSTMAYFAAPMTTLNNYQHLPPLIHSTIRRNSRFWPLVFTNSTHILIQTATSRQKTSQEEGIIAKLTINMTSNTGPREGERQHSIWLQHGLSQ